MPQLRGSFQEEEGKAATAVRARDAAAPGPGAAVRDPQHDLQEQPVEGPLLLRTWKATAVTIPTWFF